MNRHIAMWSCPRSRSTVITRAFEQLQECLILDEPFYAPYLLTHGFDHPDREDVLTYCETDYLKVIQQVTGDLPKGYTYSFQKHISKTVLPDFGRDWLKHLDNFFLIRHPQEIILSYQKVYGNITLDDIDIKSLYDVFETVKFLTGEIPLVIHSNDIVSHPKKALSKLCELLNIEFSENMLSWKKGFENSNLLFSGDLVTHAETWYSGVLNSNEFIPFQEKTVNFPDDLMPLLQDCLPAYNKFLEHCTSLIEE